MEPEDLIWSFIVGIASGLLSSLLVTAFYRKKDEERDRQNYFMSLRAYISMLMAIESSDIAAMTQFFRSNEIPPVFKWIHVKKDEWKVINKISDKVMQLEELILAYNEEELTMIDNGSEQENTAYILSDKYLPQVCFVRAEIISMSIELSSLGNATLKRYTKRKKE